MAYGGEFQNSGVASLRSLSIHLASSENQRSLLFPYNIQCIEFPIKYNVSKPPQQNNYDVIQ